MMALDLFCCDGGAAKGLHDAGFDKIIGVDIEPHPNYPFEFIQADATNPPVKTSDFDFVWSSPPCQGYMYASARWRNDGKVYPDLVEATRRFLKTTGKPYVIENVPQAPIRNDLLLCGTFFNLGVFRHRIFEISGFRAEKIIHRSHFGSVWSNNKRAVYTGGDGIGGYGNNKRKRKEMRAFSKRRYVTCAGHGGQGSARLSEWQKAMGIDWITNKKYLAEAVPPAYSEYIAKEFFRTKEFYT
jgi:DNA (cytosine-5)-methyltransferase 1